VIRPGTLIGDLNVRARAVFAKQGVEELFVHGLGHGVGLEIHEFPSLKKGSVDEGLPLEAGMVFTVEPGLYRPGLGGVRWEDMVLVTPTGYEKLFPS
ncbi:MAG: M24 family metallopeptidase, partial [Verrucomicrobiota bacterium]|nr:M24 family metallopeptidase [Verrucomicrobiota bacterium]